MPVAKSNAVIEGRIAEKLLRAIYQVARPLAHKSDGKGRKGDWGRMTTDWMRDIDM